MAKGNIILGTAIGSIGDITVSRRNGKQVQRIRVREIANPRTEGQAAQRMRLAAVTRFYSPLSVCLQKSFEGKNKSASVDKFLSLNLRKAAAQNFAVPRNAGFAPIPAQISAGTLPSPVVSYDTDNDAGFLMAIKATEAPTTLGALSQAIIDKYGLSNGDQVTLVAVRAVDLPSGSLDAATYAVEYHRFWLNTASTAELPTFGTITLSATADAMKIDEEDDALVSIGVVFSRWENKKWRRSTSSMVLPPNVLEWYAGEEAYNEFISEWMNAGAAAAPASDVYLDGSGTAAAGLNVTDGAGNNVTLVSVARRQATHTPTEGDPVTSTYIVAVDANGTQYYIQCGNRRNEYFGKYWVDPLAVADEPDGTFNYVVTPNDNSAIDTWATWFVEQGLAFSEVATFIGAF